MNWEDRASNEIRKNHELRAKVERLTLLIGEMDRASWDLLKERERVLNAKVERLTAALTQIADLVSPTAREPLDPAIAIARAALERERVLNATENQRLRSTV